MYATADPDRQGRAVVRAAAAVLSVLIVVLAAACGVHSEPSVPASAPTAVDCRTPKPLPKSRWADCERAAVYALDWKNDLHVAGARYNAADGTMVIDLRGPVSDRQRYDYQDRVQRAIGLKTVMVVVEDLPPSLR